MTKPRPSERFRYWFDNWMARGTAALMALLGIATVVVVLIVFVLVMVFSLFGQYPNDDAGFNWGDVLWGNLMRTLDPGTMGGDTGWAFRVFMLLITIAGLIIVAALIGIISGAFDAKVEELRKGRSRVLERDHTLILGWSSKVFSLVSEISIANESRSRSAIVILAELDKVEMEDAIRAQVSHKHPKGSGKTKIICRTGDPMNLHDLELGNPQAARSIVLLASDDHDDPDSEVIKTALALTNNPQRKAERYHIVGELKDPANLEAARLVGRDEAHWVLASELISRVTVQTSRQSGLSVVYTELLDFGGDEIYVTEQPALVGKNYFETQFAFADSAVIGVVKDGAVQLNPKPALVYAAGDQLIVIAEDDSTIRLAEPVPFDDTKIVSPKPYTMPAEKTLVLGYNSGLPSMLDELSEYVASGSRVLVVADADDPQLSDYPNMSVTFRRADPTSRAVLDTLGVHESDHIIVLAAKETLSTQRADAKTLITLLHLRDIAERLDHDLNVVSEMLDDRNRELAEVTNADDFIVSEKLVALMLSQVSENRQLTEVFDTLFSSSGSEVYLRPAELYIKAGETVDFYTILEAARRVGETAIGYRIAKHAHHSEQSYGVVVNPSKAAPIDFAPGDTIIVLAEG